MSHEAEAVVEQFITGFNEADADKILGTLASYVVMFGEPEDSTGFLQAHMFLNGSDVDEWVKGMIHEASPNENEFKVVNTHEKKGAVVVTTRETGHNRYRKWENRAVSYILGDFDGRWKIVGYFQY